MPRGAAGSAQVEVACNMIARPMLTIWAGNPRYPFDAGMLHA